MLNFGKIGKSFALKHKISKTVRILALKYSKSYLADREIGAPARYGENSNSTATGTFVILKNKTRGERLRT